MTLSNYVDILDSSSITNFNRWGIGISQPQRFVCGMVDHQWGGSVDGSYLSDFSLDWNDR